MYDLYQANADHHDQHCQDYDNFGDKSYDNDDCDEGGDDDVMIMEMIIDHIF